MDTADQTKPIIRVFLPLTRQGGLGYYDGMNLPVCIVQNAKNKDLLVGKHKGDLNIQDGID